MFELWVCISSIVLGLCVTFKWCENDGQELENIRDYETCNMQTVKNKIGIEG